MAASYIPAKDADFSNWLLNFYTLINAAPTTYGLIAGDATAIGTVNTAFQAAFTLATDPATRTAPTVAAKDVARANAEAVCRPYAIQISLNAGVTDEDKVAVGVTVKKLVPTPVPPPSTQPILGLVAQQPGVVQLSYRDASLPSGKAKPPGAIGLELWAAVGTVAATDPAQASFKGTITKSPLVQSFDNADKGKIVVFWSRWVTKSGAGGRAYVGPWSASLQTIVI